MPFFHSKDWTPQAIAKVSEHGGKRGITAGSWIGDMAALGTPLVLCEMCIRRWNVRANGYVAKDLWPGQRWVLGDCDGCQKMCQGTLLVPNTKEN